MKDRPKGTLSRPQGAVLLSRPLHGSPSWHWRGGELHRLGISPARLHSVSSSRARCLVTQIGIHMVCSG